MTKPFMPPKSEVYELLDSVWQRNWITNNGPLLNELELQLKEFLGVQHILVTANGTLALQIAMKALDLEGEVITTPFSYVATTSSIVWEGLEPVFVDIDLETYNIDVSKIEDAITERTSAIVATHVFGNPCDIEGIQRIAQKHNLKVVYDAAHAFGTAYQGKSAYLFGDISVASFHATKPFHTVEGGAVVSTQPELIKTLSFLRNFGHKGLEDFEGVGINAKNSEFHAAVGLVNLKYMKDILRRRQELSQYYDRVLRELKVTRQKIGSDVDYNYAYYPVLFETEALAVKNFEVLNESWVYPRRYFYPSLNTLPYVKPQQCPVSEDIASRILCLPLYHELTFADIDLISRILLRTQKYG